MEGTTNLNSFVDSMSRRSAVKEVTMRSKSASIDGGYLFEIKSLNGAEIKASISVNQIVSLFVSASLNVTGHSEREKARYSYMRDNLRIKSISINSIFDTAKNHRFDRTFDFNFPGEISTDW